MKIFAAGSVTETNTFSPVPTGLEDFIVQRGKDVLAGRVDYPGAVAPDPRLCKYHRVNTQRLYPWAEDPLAR